MVLKIEQDGKSDNLHQVNLEVSVVLSKVSTLTNDEQEVKS